MSAIAEPRESVRWFEAGDETVLGVLTEPVGTPRGVGVVFLNGGHGGSASGKNRIYTRMATDLAGRGFHTLRLEWHGIGDSTGAIDEYVMDEPFVDEAYAAAGVLRSAGVDRIAIYGECLGARTAIVAADAIPDLVAMYLVTLVLRDGALSEQSTQRMVSELPASAYLRHLGKLRHLGDPQRRAFYAQVARDKVRQTVRQVRNRADHSHLAPWVSEQAVRGLEGAGRRGIDVRLVYGAPGELDPHAIDFVDVVDELGPMRHPSISYQVLDEAIAGYRTLHVQDVLVGAVGQWFDDVVPTALVATRAS